MAVFVRSAEEVPRARAAVEAANLLPHVLDDGVKTVRDRVSVGTMLLSKGLEFRAVAVIACDDEIVPLQSRIETVTDEGISRRCTTPSVTSCTSPALVPAITCL
jgi:superfamily I DNA/RNA helicase